MNNTLTNIIIIKRNSDKDGTKYVQALNSIKFSDSSHERVFWWYIDGSRCNLSKECLNSKTQNKVNFMVKHYNTERAIWNGEHCFDFPIELPRDFFCICCSHSRVYNLNQNTFDFLRNAKYWILLQKSIWPNYI